jgi:DNA replication protein DnaC
MAEVIELEGGYGVRTRCQDCGRERVLDCREVEDRDGTLIRTSARPNRIAVALADTMLCEACGVAASSSEDRTRREAAMARNVRESGIPGPLFAEATWPALIEEGKTPDETQRRRAAIAAAKAWAATRRPGRGLLLHGPAGSGKTRLAATAAVARLAHSPIRWVSVGVLMAQLDGAWNDAERQDALKVLTSKGPVVLDDFDKVNPNARLQAALFTALDKREQSGAALLVTTNLAPAELERRFSEPIVSRLTGMCVVLQYPGADLRQSWRL